MKLLLLQPPIRDFYDTEIRLQPLGLCMLKAAVKKSLPWIDVVVKDFHQGHGRKTLPYPPEFGYLKPYYPYPDSSPFSMFHQFYHFGASYEEVARDVILEKPDMVGISSLFSSYYSEALACAGEIKKHLNIPVLMGGPHVSALPMEVLREQNVDYIIRGEGERPLVKLLSAMDSGGSLRGVPNLGFKCRGEMILNPMEKPYDIDDLPCPDFSDFPVDRYLFERRPMCLIMTSRGCPHRCTFCSVHQTFGTTFRRRAVENVVSEIKERYSQGYRVFDFEDDNLSFPGEEFRDLLLRIRADVPQHGVQFTAMNGISYMNLDREILGMMKAAGFKCLNLSLVSSSPDTLSRLQRPHTVEKFLEVVRCAHELGLDMVCYQIAGLPFETLDDMISTMTLLAGLPVLIGVSIFYLVPGCAMAREFDPISRVNCIKSRSTAMAIESSQITRNDLYTLFITARVINFMKGLEIAEKETNFDRALDASIRSKKKKRELMGADILRRLLHEGILYAATGNGYKPLPCFNGALFLKVWNIIPSIVTQDGVVIHITSEGMAKCP